MSVMADGGYFTIVARRMRKTNIDGNFGSLQPRKVLLRERRERRERTEFEP